MSTDFFPTILEMAGVRRQPGQAPDGLSLVPLLRQTGTVKHDAIYWHYPHYHPGGTSPAGAVRCGDWKLIEYFEDGHVELYDLKHDLSETTDLAAKMPDKAEELRKMLADWRTSVDAVMPTPNPDYDPARERERPKTATTAPATG